MCLFSYPKGVPQKCHFLCKTVQTILKASIFKLTCLHSNTLNSYPSYSFLTTHSFSRHIFSQCSPEAHMHTERMTAIRHSNTKPFANYGM